MGRAFPRMVGSFFFPFAARRPVSDQRGKLRRLRLPASCSYLRLSWLSRLSGGFHQTENKFVERPHRDRALVQFASATTWRHHENLVTANLRFLLHLLASLAIAAASFFWGDLPLVGPLGDGLSRAHSTWIFLWLWIPASIWIALITPTYLQYGKRWRWFLLGAPIALCWPVLLSLVLAFGGFD